jgi:hypothetical protein
MEYLDLEKGGIFQLCRDLHVTFVSQNERNPEDLADVLNQNILNPRWCAKGSYLIVISHEITKKEHNQYLTVTFYSQGEIARSTPMLYYQFKGYLTRHKV